MKHRWTLKCLQLFLLLIQIGLITSARPRCLHFSSSIFRGMRLQQTQFHILIRHWTEGCCAAVADSIKLIIRRVNSEEVCSKNGKIFVILVLH